MDFVRASAHLPATTLEVVEAVFAERVTTTAVFCASHQLTSSEPLDVGSRVELEVATEDGVVAFICRGVVGWLYPDDAVPPGRESGVGILVGEVTEGGERFSRMVARAGAGGRVRLPGARVLQRLKIDLAPGAGVPLLAPPTAPAPPAPDRLRQAVAPVAPAPSSSADATALIERPSSLEADPSSDASDVFGGAADSDEGAFARGPAGSGATIDDADDDASPSHGGPPPAPDRADAADAADSAAAEAADADNIQAPPPAPASVEDDVVAASAPADADPSTPDDPPAGPDEAAAGEGDDDEAALLDDDDIEDLEDLEDAEDVVAVLHEPTLSFVDEDFVEEAPAADVADRLQVLAAALQRLGGNADNTGLDGPTLDGESGEGAARSQPGPGALGLDDLSSLEELNLPGDTVAPPVAASRGLILDLSDVSAFPEAGDTARPFEAQSTDVDLLASLSAGDIVPIPGPGDADTGAMTLPPFADPFERASTPPVVHQAGPGTPTSGARARDGDLLDDGWPQGPDSDWRSVDTELYNIRGLPEVDGWPEWSDLLDARTLGVAFSVTPRGVTGLEFFSWPLQGSKRYSGIGQGDAADPRRSRTAIVAMADLDDSLGDAPADADSDEDVFSAPQPPLPEPAAIEDDDDPFASRTTDPRLNVEGLVARHVRASHLDVTAVFESSGLDDEPGTDLALDGLGVLGGDADVTRDEMILPRARPVIPTKALADPLSGTDSGEGLTSSESSEERS